MEKNVPVTSERQNNISIFGFNDITNVQRGYRIDNNDPNYYTFLGFSQATSIGIAIRNLHQEKIVIKSI